MSGLRKFSRRATNSPFLYRRVRSAEIWTVGEGTLDPTHITGIGNKSVGYVFVERLFITVTVKVE